MNQLLKKTLVFVISIAMIFTVTSVSFAGNGDGGAKAGESTGIIIVDPDGEETVITAEDIEDAYSVEVTRDDAWTYNNGPLYTYGTFYSLASILTSAGIDTADMTGLSLIATDGYISSIDVETADSLLGRPVEPDDIYIFDMAQAYTYEVDEEGNIPDVSTDQPYSSKGGYGAAVNGSEGNKWAKDLYKLSLLKAEDFAQARRGANRYFAKLTDALVTKKGDATIILLNDTYLEESDNAVIYTEKTGNIAATTAIDLNGCELGGYADLTGAADFEIKDSKGTGYVYLTLMPDENFGGKIVNSVEDNFFLAKDDETGEYWFAERMPISDSSVQIKLSETAFVYDGAAKEPAVTAVESGTYGDTGEAYSYTLVKGEDYNVAYANNINAGTATVTITGLGYYKGTVTAAFTIAKAANTMTVKAKKAPKIKKNKVKKKAQKLAASKVVTVSNAKGAVTYAKVSGSKNLKIAKNGKVTVKKKTKKGTYKMKVNVTAAGDNNFEPVTKAVTIKVQVK